MKKIMILALFVSFLWFNPLVLVASRRIPNLALMVPFCEGRRNGYPLSNNHS